MKIIRRGVDVDDVFAWEPQRRDVDGISKSTAFTMEEAKDIVANRSRDFGIEIIFEIVDAFYNADMAKMGGVEFFVRTSAERIMQRRVDVVKPMTLGVI